MLLITYFTTDRVLLSTFVLSDINNIIRTPQDAIINRKNCGQITVSNDRANYQNCDLQEKGGHYAHARAHGQARTLPNPAALGPEIEEGAVNRSPLQALLLLPRGDARPATGQGAI